MQLLVHQEFVWCARPISWCATEFLKRSSWNASAQENAESCQADHMPHTGVKVSNKITLKEHTRFAPQNSCILLGRVSTKIVKSIVKLEILNIWHFFFCYSFSNFSWTFFSVVHTKVLFWIFEILRLWFFRFHNYRTLLEPKLQNAAPHSDHFWIFPEFSSQWSSQKYWIFEILCFWFLWEHSVHYRFSNIFYVKNGWS